jgi:hypothetical protein
VTSQDVCCKRDYSAFHVLWEEVLPNSSVISLMPSRKNALMHLSVVRKYLEENFTDYDGYYEIEDLIEKNALTLGGPGSSHDFCLNSRRKSQKSPRSMFDTPVDS